MAIIRLESHRNRCLVVGEDMGVVPDEIRSCMHSSGMYSNKVFYFERDHQQQFADPVSHPSDALLMVTNHDVSTLAGWWETSDLQLRCETGNINQQELARQLQERSEDKRRLLQWLNERQSLPAAWCEALAAGQGLNAEVLNKPFDLALCGAILAVCARSAARLMSFQFEDLQLLTTPVNIPGTYREYPNWRRKQQQQTSALFADPDITAVLSIMVKQRQGKNIDLYQALQSINVAKDAAKNTATNVSTVRATTNYK
jgi:4-alpha-glucanotransferase